MGIYPSIGDTLQQFMSTPVLLVFGSFLLAAMLNDTDRNVIAMPVALSNMPIITRLFGPPMGIIRLPADPDVGMAIIRAFFNARLSSVRSCLQLCSMIQTFPSALSVR